MWVLVVRSVIYSPRHHLHSPSWGCVSDRWCHHRRGFCVFLNLMDVLLVSVHIWVKDGGISYWLWLQRRWLGGPPPPPSAWWVCGLICNFWLWVKSGCCFVGNGGGLVEATPCRQVLLKEGWILILSWFRSSIFVGLILSTLGRISYCIARKGYDFAIWLIQVSLWLLSCYRFVAGCGGFMNLFCFRVGGQFHVPSLIRRT